MKNIKYKLKRLVNVGVLFLFFRTLMRYNDRLLTIDGIVLIITALFFVYFTYIDEYINKD